MRFILILSFFILTAPKVQAQWLDAALTYSNIEYEEPDIATQKGRMAGVRGELGMPLLAGFSVTGQAEYQSGNLTYEGTSLSSSTTTTLITKDYFRDYRGLANYTMGMPTVSGGVGQRYWYNNNSQYRRRVQYDYVPVVATLRRRGLYFKAEMDLWKSGQTIAEMSDVSAARTDVTLKHDKGSGYGGEIGILIPNALHISSLIYVSYHHWQVDASDTVSDGVASQTAPKSTTNVTQVGVGFDF